MISISRLVILTSLPFFYLFLFCIVRIRRTRTFTVFPVLSLLQIPVLQMISLYRSSPRRVKSIFSSCVCAQRTSFCPSHNSKYKKTARIIFWRPLATKRFLRFFLSFVTTKQFYGGITTALICVGLSVLFCTMHNFIRISFALFCAYITMYPLISRKRPESTWQTGLLPSTDPSSPYSPRRQYNAPAGRSWEGFHHLMLIFS